MGNEEINDIISFDEKTYEILEDLAFENNESVAVFVKRLSYEMIYLKYNIKLELD